MSEIPKRLAPTHKTLRELYLKSGNVCAFPGCNALLMDEEGTFIGQLCHIEAAEPRGARFNPAMTNEERRSAPNLMLMCYPHHVITNDAERYSVLDLKEIKAAHERRFARPDRAMRERLAKAKWVTLVGAGAVTGVTIDDIVSHIKSALNSVLSSPESKEPTLFRKELQRRLRYAPTGVVYYYSADPLHTAVGDQFLEIFKGAGWTIERLQSPLVSAAGETRDFERSMLMIFVIGEEDQLSNTRQAIDDFFRMCGFSSAATREEAVRDDGAHRITIYVPVLVRRKLMDQTQMR